MVIRKPGGEEVVVYFKVPLQYLLRRAEKRNQTSTRISAIHSENRTRDCRMRKGNGNNLLESVSAEKIMKNSVRLFCSSTRARTW